MKYIFCRAGGTHRNINKPNKRKIHTHSLPPGLCGYNFITLRCPQRGLSSQSLGKYWQLNQSNQHTSTYSRIQQRTKNPYYATIHNEYAQEHPRINRQDRRKVTFPGSAYPKEIPQQYTPATQTEAVHCQGVLLGVFHPVSDHWRLLDSPWGRVAKPFLASTLFIGTIAKMVTVANSLQWKTLISDQVDCGPCSETLFVRILRGNSQPQLKYCFLLTALLTKTLLLRLTLSLLQHTHPPYWHSWRNQKITNRIFLTHVYGLGIVYCKIRLCRFAFNFNVFFKFIVLFFHNARPQ